MEYWSPTGAAVFWDATHSAGACDSQPSAFATSTPRAPFYVPQDPFSGTLSASSFLCVFDEEHELTPEATTSTAAAAAGNSRKRVQVGTKSATRVIFKDETHDEHEAGHNQVPRRESGTGSSTTAVKRRQPPAIAPGGGAFQQAVAVAGQKKPSTSTQRALARQILRMQAAGEGRGLTERYIRETLGNNPDTSKALRGLTLDGFIMRVGSGGKTSPFLYHITDKGKLEVANLDKVEAASELQERE